MIAVLPLFALLLALVACATPARAGDPDALWKIIHDKCLPDEAEHASPAPCAEVDLVDGDAHGSVVLKDRDGATQFLLMPTAKITGIEDPAILAPQAPNYWQAAWAARSWFLGRVGHDMPRDAISLAINSPYGRTQNQLHIHIDCLRSDVHATLQAQAPAAGPAWTPVAGGLAGHAYRMMRLDTADLDGVNPFRVLAENLGEGGIGRHSLVVVGEQFPDGHDGFVLLDDQVDLPTGDRASGEELQDHTCALAHDTAN